MLWNKIISYSGEILQTYKDILRAVLDLSSTLSVHESKHTACATHQLSLRGHAPAANDPAAHHR